MRTIDADVLHKCKFHGYEELEITPIGVNVESYKLGWNDAIDAIAESEPTVEPAQRWIPCSKKLPDKEGRYLVWAEISFIPDHVDEPSTYHGTSIASYFERWSPHWYGNKVEKVIAWQPLPKPYMEGVSDD